MKFKFSIFALCLFTPFAMALAADKPQPLSHAEACKEDIQRLCKDVKQGEGRVIKCLEEKTSQVTVGCKEKLDEIIEAREIHSKMKNFRATCKADLDTLCAGVQAGKGRQIKCLRTNGDKVTAPCKNLLEAEGMMFGMTNPTTAVNEKPAEQKAPATTTNNPTGGTAPAAPAAPATPPTK